MSYSHDDSKIELQRRTLRHDRERGMGATLSAFVRLSGPGWMQAAMSLGAGTLASSLYLGVLGGVHLLWVPPVALVLGLIMLSAIAYVTLSVDEPPLAAMNRHVNPLLGWIWGFGVLFANVIWILPQFALTTEVVQVNLLPDFFGSSSRLSEMGSRAIISLIAFAVALAASWIYALGGRGIKLYDYLIKFVVAIIVLSFFLVILLLSVRQGAIDWRSVVLGFIPHADQALQPIPGYQNLIDRIGSADARAYWSKVLVAEQRNVMIAAASAAVGMNMTYQLAYSLRSRGWDREFRSLAIFDLWTGLLVPFTLAVSCVAIAAASQFHAKPVNGLLDARGNLQVPVDDPKYREFEKLMNLRLLAIPASQSPIEPGERTVAASILRRNAGDLADALTPLLGRTLAQLVFGVGIIGMTLSSMSLMMLISGWLLCEMLGQEQNSKCFYFGTLICSVGLLWPLLWGVDDVKFWLAIAASSTAYILLPIAFWAFFLMMNSKSLLRDQMPRPSLRFVWNTMMVLAAGLVSVASLYVMTSVAGWWSWMGLAVLAIALLLAGSMTTTNSQPK